MKSSKAAECESMHLKHANGPQSGNDLHFTSISMTVIILSFDGKFQEVRTHIPEGFYFTYAEKSWHQQVS